ILTARPPERLFHLVFESPWWKGLGAESEEKREPVSDIDTGVVVSLKVLDPDGRLEKRTNSGRLGMSALCQKRTYAPRQKYRYSITSLARPDRVGGTSTPSSVGGMSSTPLGVETARLFDTELRVQGVGAPHAVKDYFSANTWIVPPCGTSRY